MEKKEAMLVYDSKRHEEMEGAHRATGISSCGRAEGQAGLSLVPDSSLRRIAELEKTTKKLEQQTSGKQN